MTTHSNDKVTAEACHRDEIVLTNYISRNPIIRLLLNNFMARIGKVLTQIQAIDSRGLDAGCGEGHLLAYLYEHQLVSDMVAVDLDQRKLDYAQRHYPFCRYQRGNIQDLEFDSNTFDFVLSTEVFEHLPDPAKALEELERVAKPAAHIIISVPFEPFFHWGNIVRGKYWHRGGRTPDHLNFWHRNEFRSFLSPRVAIKNCYSVSTFPWILCFGQFR
jgi:2-polyprenyl-3-methyl-5-hydroxy-6-metoxy-1,4-benzoquinol methylase